MFKSLFQTTSPQKEAKKIRPWGAMEFDDENESSLEIGERVNTPEPSTINLSAHGSFPLNETVPYNIETDSIIVNEGPENSNALNTLAQEAGNIFIDKTGKITRQLSGIVSELPDSLGDLLFKQTLGLYKESEKPAEKGGNSPEETEAQQKKIATELSNKQFNESVESERTRVKQEDENQMMRHALRMDVSVEDAGQLLDYEHLRKEHLKNIHILATTSQKKKDQIKAKNEAEKQVRIIPISSKKAAGGPSVNQKTTFEDQNMSRAG